MSYYAHSTLSPKKSVIDIPPRKLLTRGARPAPLDGDSLCMLSSPKFSSADETLLQRFLPCNGGDDDDADPYGSDHFRMFEFKVRRCTRSRSHDWTDCPFAHPGEKARRRDPRRFHYSGTVCPEYRRGGCARGDNCEFAHGVFECWLHPARYRTEACKDGKNCKRKVCFFAHTARELRVLPLHSPESSPVAPGKHHRNHCCLLCSHATSSPTSTLLSHLSSSSPPMSPPVSPMNHRTSLSGLSPFSRFLNSSSEHASGVMMGGPHFYSSPTNYKDTLSELMCSLDAMRFNDAVSASPVSGADGNALWVDDRQFALSPSTSNNYASNIGGSTCDPDHPDLGWVNDLLM